MTGKIGKSHPHFQAKHRVSPQFLAGGGITSLGLRFYNVASGETNLSTASVSLTHLKQRNSSTSPRLPLSFRTTPNSKSTTRSSRSAFRRDLFQSAALLSRSLSIITDL